MRAIPALLLTTLVSACEAPDSPLHESAPCWPEPCSQAWQAALEAALGTGDGHGHGPDIGSEEWMSVIEFKLAIRDDPDVPPAGSDAWCAHINRQMADRQKLEKTTFP